MTVFERSDGSVDIGATLEPIAQEVGKALPGAQFEGIVFSGKCQDLSRLEGRLIFLFAQVNRRILRPQAVRATASIDTVRRTMNLHYQDVSDFYPSVRHRTLTDVQSIYDAAAAASEHISDLGLSDCNVTVTQLDSAWDVRCGPLANFLSECRFEVINGEIREE